MVFAKRSTSSAEQGVSPFTNPIVVIYSCKCIQVLDSEQALPRAEVVKI